MSVASSPFGPNTSRRLDADRCPGGFLLHAAEDGQLARIRLPGGRLDGQRMLAIASLAESGNGLIDVTSRANLQIRGLPAGAESVLRLGLEGAGLLPSARHDRVRNILASPVAGRHPHSVIAIDEIVCSLDDGLCARPELSELGGRFLFCIDDGSGLGVDPAADVVLTAERSGRVSLALAGAATSMRVDASRAAEIALDAAGAFLEVRARDASPAWRISDVADGAARVAGRIGATVTGARTAVRPAELAPGPLEQRDGRIAITALAPLGRLDVASLRALADLALAERTEVRLSRSRTVTIVDIGANDWRDVAAEMQRAGLDLSLRSGWVGLSACAGIGRCPKARIDVRQAVARRAAVRGPSSAPEHWSACERRCGERADQAVAVVADSDAVTVTAASGTRIVADAEAALAVLA